MSADGDGGEILEGFEDGAPFFVVNPANSDAPSSVWQYASINNEEPGDSESSDEDFFNETACEDQETSKNGHCYAGVRGGRTQKKKVVWTPELHSKFLEAIEKIGVDRAVPKKILELMKVEGLTRDNIASHLQKYRIFLKKLEDARYGVQVVSEPSLLESSATTTDHRAPCKNSSLMLNKPNWPSYSSTPLVDPPVLDTSSFSFPTLEASSFNTTTPSELTPSRSLFQQGVTMLTQATPKSLDREGDLIYDATELGAWNSCVNSANPSNSGFVQNLDGFVNDYGGSTIDEHPCKRGEIGSSTGSQSNKELWIMSSANTGNSGESSFLQNSNGFNHNCASQSELLEMGSSNGPNHSNTESLTTWDDDQIEMNTDLLSNLANGIGEDDLILDAADIASIWETFISEETYVDHNGEYGTASTNQFASLEPECQQHSNEEAMANNNYQDLDGYIPGVHPIFDMHDHEQLLEFVWRPEPVEQDLILHGLF